MIRKIIMKPTFFVSGLLSGVFILVALSLPSSKFALPLNSTEEARFKKSVGVKNEDEWRYGKAFKEELTKLGQITPQQFAARFGLPDQYLPQITVDPTQARYFADFDQEVIVQPNIEPQRYDFRLNAEELALFKKNGFVASQRLGTWSFGEIHYRLFKNDLPIFVTSDAILHAWHESYDAILAELESLIFSSMLSEILKQMSEKLVEAQTDYGQGQMEAGLLDADFFLTTARSFLSGGIVPSPLRQDARVAEALRLCSGSEMVEYPLFGKKRQLDCSQFTPRGRYSETPELQRYFRAMMWCGRIDFRLAGNPDESSPREMAGALVLHDLMRRAGQFSKWVELDQLLQTFVGRADSLNFAQLDSILREANVNSPPVR
jgi:hypothetical protein